MESIFWTLYCNDQRTSAITNIQRVVSAYGDIVDTNHFSDLSLNIRVEIEERKVDELYHRLQQQFGIDAFEPLHSHSKRERIIYLNIVFGKGTGNLRVEVPSVPG